VLSIAGMAGSHPRNDPLHILDGPSHTTLDQILAVEDLLALLTVLASQSQTDQVGYLAVFIALKIQKRERDSHRADLLDWIYPGSWITEDGREAGCCGLSHHLWEDLLPLCPLLVQRNLHFHLPQVEV